MAREKSAPTTTADSPPERGPSKRVGTGTRKEPASKLPERPEFVLGSGPGHWHVQLGRLVPSLSPLALAGGLYGTRVAKDGTINARILFGRKLGQGWTLLEDAYWAEEDLEEETPRVSFWTPSRVVIYSILVLLVVIGVYLWLFPHIGRDALNFVYPGAGDRVIGPATKSAGPTAPGGINFAEVKERFTKSTAAGDLLVISGLAVNEYEYPVGRVKLRGKILDHGEAPRRSRRSRETS